jgi:hypothetical protein
MKQATFDLLDQVPTTIGDNKEDPVFKSIRKEVEKEEWVKKSDIRFREEGHVYFGEIFIVPVKEYKLTDKVESLQKKIYSLNWRIYDVTIMLVNEL